MSTLGILNSIQQNDPSKLERYLKNDKGLANTPLLVDEFTFLYKQPLELAVEYYGVWKNIELVNILLKYGAEPNYITSFGPLLQQTTNSKVAEMLLKYGADPNLTYQDMVPLDSVINDPEKLEVLLKYGANPFNSTGTGRSVLSKQQYEFTKDEDFKKYFKIEYELYQQAEIEYLRRWEELKQAILSEDLEKIHTEIINNFDVNFKDSNGLNPYQFALNNNKSEIAEMFEREQKEKKKKAGCLGILILILLIISTLVNL
jgi:ankyrin repeat protein